MRVKPAAAVRALGVDTLDDSRLCSDFYGEVAVEHQGLGAVWRTVSQRQTNLASSQQRVWRALGLDAALVRAATEGEALACVR